MTLMTRIFDPNSVKKVFAHYPSGVAAIAATVEGEDTVLVSSSFSVGISFEPPMVMFAAQKSSQSWPLLRHAPRLGVSVLANEQSHLCRQLAGDRNTRFDGVSIDRTDMDAIIITGASIWLDCTVFAEHDAGDHTLIILEAHSFMSNHDSDPLVYHGSRFRPMN